MIRVRCSIGVDARGVPCLAGGHYTSTTVGSSAMCYLTETSETRPESHFPISHVEADLTSSMDGWTDGRTGIHLQLHVISSKHCPGRPPVSLCRSRCFLGGGGGGRWGLRHRALSARITLRWDEILPDRLCLVALKNILWLCLAFKFGVPKFIVATL
jgi:hypothetical protein